MCVVWGAAVKVTNCLQLLAIDATDDKAKNAVPYPGYLIDTALFNIGTKCFLYHL